MKKLILATSLLVALFLSSNLLAQVHVGVKGSFNMMNMNVKLNDNKVDEFKIKPAFNAGLFAEFAIADEFYLRPELLFSSKGAAYKKTEEFLLIDEKREIDSKTTLNYIELPIYFLYKGRLSSGN
ncbi:MAG: outer membrane beta-barrel protein, partial [Lentimicrobiaceae bacterium]|nr:outer membrane beta-barrel protein [Lentimicrobiaceae bacterium]